MSLESLLDSLLTVPSVHQSNLMGEPLGVNKNIASSPGSLSSLDPPKITSILENAIKIAIDNLSITFAEIRPALDSKDIDLWNRSKTSTDLLVRNALVYLAQSEVAQGVIPSYFTMVAECDHCGPVLLWRAGNVSECPWCSNRSVGKPIPRRYFVSCKDCLSFDRIDHPHLGHCGMGQPEAPAGLWDDDRHNCDYWVPVKKRCDLKN